MSTIDPSTESTLAPWWPHKPAIYDIHKTYMENAEQGPFFSEEIPLRHWKEPNEWIDFLGYDVTSPIGVPAGPLLNSKWTALAGKLGFDLLVYKTIRSSSHPGHPLPNMIFIEPTTPLIPGQMPDHLTQRETIPQTMEEVGVTNSFGMPSRSQDYLAVDIPIANARCYPGQVLIVSIVGSSPEDFVHAARFAKKCGAKAIEANFSCPNVATGEGSLYLNPESVGTIAQALVSELKDIPLILKVGLFPNRKILQEVFEAAARAGVRAMAGINTISMKVLTKEGKPALGPDRLTSGICGSPIRDAALQFTREAREVIDREKLGLKLIGVGGIVLQEHFTDLLNAGADYAMTATGMIWDPLIALRYHEAHQ